MGFRRPRNRSDHSFLRLQIPFGGYCIVFSKNPVASAFPNGWNSERSSEVRMRRLHLIASAATPSLGTLFFCLLRLRVSISSNKLLADHKIRRNIQMPLSANFQSFLLTSCLKLEQFRINHSTPVLFTFERSHSSIISKKVHCKICIFCHVTFWIGYFGHGGELAFLSENLF